MIEMNTKQAIARIEQLKDEIKNIDELIYMIGRPHERGEFKHGEVPVRIAGDGGRPICLDRDALFGVLNVRRKQCSGELEKLESVIAMADLALKGLDK